MSDRFDKFTERAKQVLVLAQEAAQHFNHNYIGTEHLLLGLVREEQGLAAAVLRELGAGTDRVRDAVEHVIGRGDRMVIGDLSLTPRAKKVIELAVEEARRLDHSHIGTEHLLLGLVREGEGIAAGVLASLGVELGAVRAAVLRVVGRSGAGGWQTSGGARLVRRTGAPVRGPGAPDAELLELVDVLPVGASHRVSGETVTLLSVERYRDGFLAQLRVLSEYAPPATLLERAGLMPEVHLAAADDRGGAYTPWPHGGSGGLRGAAEGGRSVLQWRHAFRFAPALVPEARELRLTVERVEWHRYEPERSETVVERALAGPWAFTVALPPPTPAPGV